MTNITEKTAPNVSVGADTEQQFSKSTEDIITEDDEILAYGKTNVADIGRFV